jgi:hypothetical protein
MHRDIHIEEKKLNTENEGQNTHNKLYLLTKKKKS